MPHSSYAMLPEIDLIDMAKRAIQGGASPKFTIKHLTEGGVSEEVATRVVDTVVNEIAADREAERDQKRQNSKHAVIFGLGFILGGVALSVAGWSLPNGSPKLAAVGLPLVLFGIRRLIMAAIHLYDNQ